MTGLISKTLFLCLAAAAISSAQNYPKLYEYFREGGNNSGLVASNKEFTLNGKYIRLIGGAIHYFRHHPSQWRDKIRKLRALGANAVETYVSWNLHEPKRGVFDFGDGGNDFSEFMNIRQFIQIAQEEDLLVILRPGPYICAEWEYGGMPSWLLRDPHMEVRQNYQPFLDRTKIFFDNFLAHIKDLQFTRGGPIIALQIENEYASFAPNRSREYLESIRQAFIDNDFSDCLFFTADNSGWNEIRGGLPGVYQTANTHGVDGAFAELLEVQPDMPLMVMEFYPGWANHWGDEYKGSRDTKDYLENLEKTYDQYKGSTVFYMFAGGTNFGFMAGSNWKDAEANISSTTTSYDFDVLLSEAGDYTEKYELSAVLINKYEDPKLWRPQRPDDTRKVAYPTVQLQDYMTYNDIIDRIPMFEMDKPVSMENLPINDDNGQSFGYIIYRKRGTFGNGDTLRVSYPKDFAQLIVDGMQVFDTVPINKPTTKPEDYWVNGVREFQLSESTDGNPRVDVMIENPGRIVFNMQWDFYERKGIDPSRGSKIEINDREIEGVEIFAAEFTNSWVKNLTNWRSPIANLNTPILIRSTFTISEEPRDTYLDMREWHKGVVFINGFNIGRYWKVGPQYTLYAPAALFKQGENEIVIFEQLEAGSEIRFLDYPILGETANNPKGNIRHTEF